MQPNISFSKKQYYLLGGLALLLIFWGANPWQHFFLNDDFIHIPLAADGTVGHHNSLRHVNDFSLFLDYRLSGENPVGYHITNLVLHLACMVIGFVLLKRVAKTMDRELPNAVLFLAILSFGSYAFHSETVFWVLCRTASLSFLFVLLSWLCLLKTARQKIWWLPMVLCFLIALFTYEIAFLFLPWLLIWWLAMPKNKIVERKLAKQGVIALVAIFLMYFPYRKYATGEYLGTYEAAQIQAFDPMALVMNIFRLFGRSFVPPTEWLGLYLALSVGAIVVCLGLVAWMIVKRKADRFWWCLLLCWAVAYAPFISLGISTKGYESERYLYVASFFLCFFIVYNLYILFKPRWFLLLTSVFLLFHTFFYWRAGEDFKKAGRFAQKTMQAINVAATTHSVVVIDRLPLSWKGIPLFRFGFEDAVNWLGVPKGKQSKVLVRSKWPIADHLPAVLDHMVPSGDTIVIGFR
jgi:hypothetical protein